MDLSYVLQLAHSHLTKYGESIGVVMRPVNAGGPGYRAPPPPEPWLERPPDPERPPPSALNPSVLTHEYRDLAALAAERARPDPAAVRNVVLGAPGTVLPPAAGNMLCGTRLFPPEYWPVVKGDNAPSRALGPEWNPAAAAAPSTGAQPKPGKCAKRDAPMAAASTQTERPAATGGGSQTKRRRRRNRATNTPNTTTTTGTNTTTDYNPASDTASDDDTADANADNSTKNNNSNKTNNSNKRAKPTPSLLLTPSRSGKTAAAADHVSELQGALDEPPDELMDLLTTIGQLSEQRNDNAATTGDKRHEPNAPKPPSVAGSEFNWDHEYDYLIGDKVPALSQSDESSEAYPASEISLGGPPLFPSDEGGNNREDAGSVDSEYVGLSIQPGFIHNLTPAIQLDDI